MRRNSDFVAVAFPVASAYLNYSELYSSYRARRKRYTKTKFQEALDEVEQKGKACTATLQQISNIKLSLSSGLAELSRASHEKKLLVSQLCEQLVLLKNVVTNRKLLNDLRRRIRQQDASQSSVFEENARKKVTFQCLNSSADLSWDKAIALLETPLGCFISGPLSSFQLHEVATIVSAEVAVSMREIAAIQHIEGQGELALLQQQLLVLFPVMLVSRGGTCIVVNLHQLVVSQGTFETLLNLDSEETEQDASQLHVPATKMKAASVPSGKRGRPSIIDRFPQVVECTTNFIKQHGYSAHARRRTDTGNACGVSLTQIRDHLLEQIPGLKEHGLGRTTVAYLMVPPRQKTLAASRYKGLIKARVPAKRNDFREDHVDSHYLFARVAYRREFAMHFKEECLILSCDDMNKLKVGTLAVSRYHQITKFFPEDDKPNYPDRDCPIPGYKLIPSGYMILTDHREEGSNKVSDDNETSDTSEYDFCGSDYEVKSCTLRATSTSQSTYIPPSACESTAEPQSLPPSYTSIPDSSESTSIPQSSSQSESSFTVSVSAGAASASTSLPCSSASVIPCVHGSSLKLSLTATTGSTEASASLVIEQGIRSLDGAKTDSSMEETGDSQTSPSSPFSGSSVEDFGTSQASPSSQSHSASITEKTVKDKLGRIHYVTPHSGPALVSLRASRFHSSNIQAHIDDLDEIIEAGVEEGLTVVMLIVDGGPDWSTNSIVNALFYMRLWRDNNLDVLVATSVAARFSAFNPIEHLWSPLSKKLTGVTFNALAAGDSKPPCQISGISSDKRNQKEAEVFDRANDELCETHWADAAFDGYPVFPKSVPCHSSSCGKYDDYHAVHEFIRAPIRDLESSRNQKFSKELRFMIKHMYRRHNELIFFKCEDHDCVHCQQNPVHAFQFLKERQMTFFIPTPSDKHSDHYCTYHEMCQLKPSSLLKGDAGMPSLASGTLGRCSICPGYSFFCAADQQRHHRLVHRGRNKHIKSTKQTKFVCNYTDCGKSFQTRYQLQQHRQIVGHKRARKKTQSCQKLKQICLFSQPVQDDSQDDCADITQPVQDDSPSDSEESCATQCPVCHIFFDDDIADVTWVECSNCDKWMHAQCIPSDHPFLPNEENFFCLRCS